MKKSLLAIVSAGIMLSSSNIYAIAPQTSRGPHSHVSAISQGSVTTLEQQVSLYQAILLYEQGYPASDGGKMVTMELAEFLANNQLYMSDRSTQQEFFLRVLAQIDGLKLSQELFSSHTNSTLFASKNQAYQQALDVFGRQREIQSVTVPYQFKKSIQDGYVVIDKLEGRRTYFNNSDLATHVTDLDGKTLFVGNEARELVPVGFFKPYNSLTIPNTSNRITSKQQLKDSYPKPEGCAWNAKPGLFVLPFTLVARKSRRKLHKG
jgi:hypothetical protein